MTQPLSLDFAYLSEFVTEQDIQALEPQVRSALKSLLEKTGRGSDFLGWIQLPFDAAKQVPHLKKAVKPFDKCDDVVCVGIGGSYLGTKATIEALGGSSKVHYAGHHLSPAPFNQLMKKLNPKKTGICVISKSGTTTEPAVAFRILKSWLEKGAGKKKARKRIVAVTDQAKGALKGMADAEGYKTFVIPDDVGGRFSVLTPVGLLPIAIAGFDIGKLLKGAQAAAKDLVLKSKSFGQVRGRPFSPLPEGKDHRGDGQLQAGTTLRQRMVETALRGVGRQGREGFISGQRGPDDRPPQHGAVPAGRPANPLGNHTLGEKRGDGHRHPQG